MCRKLLGCVVNKLMSIKQQSEGNGGIERDLRAAALVQNCRTFR